MVESSKNAVLKRESDETCRRYDVAVADGFHWNTIEMGCPVDPDDGDASDGGGGSVGGGSIVVRVLNAEYALFPLAFFARTRQ